MIDTQQLGPLFDRALRGDAAALDALLGKLRPWVRLLVRPRMSHDLDASDLVQEILLRMFRGFAGFRGTSVPQFLCWVKQITRNVLADMPPRGDIGTVLEDPVAPEPEWSDIRLAELAAALDRLPSRYRSVIEARFFDGLRFAEIARQSGDKVGAVRVRCFRAIELLRQEMEASR
jgi:RNA polymerase sigma-70 factor (ECF subfamily)